MTKNIFPLIDKNIRNGLFEPLPYYPKDSWQNKNRHPWTDEEIDELCKSYGVDHSKIEQNDYQVMLWEFRPKNTSKLYISDDFIQKRLYCGRVIKIGKKCFDIFEFRTGSTCTYGDLVYYNLAAASIQKIKGYQRLIFIDDVDILGIIKSEEEVSE